MSTFNEYLNQLMNTCDSIKVNILFNDDVVNGFDNYKRTVTSGADKSGEFKTFHNLYREDIVHDFEGALLNKLVYICPSEGVYLNFSALYQSAVKSKESLSQFKSKKSQANLSTKLVYDILQCLISLDCDSEALSKRVELLKVELGMPATYSNDTPDLSAMLQMIPQMLGAIAPQLPGGSSMPQASEMQNIISTLINSKQIKNLVNELQSPNKPPDMQTIMSKVTQLTSDPDLVSSLEKTMNRPQ